LVLAYTFGLLGPAACFYLYWAVDVDFLGDAELAVHVAAVVGVLSLAIHVSRKRWSARFSAFLGGAMLSSALQALLVAVCLLPATLLGMLFAIGVLGLIPFGTAWTLHRAAAEAREVAASLPRRLRLGLATCGFALSTVSPIAHPAAEATAYQIAFARIDPLTPDSPERANAALAWVPWLSSRPLVEEALSSTTDVRFQLLSRLCELRFGFAIDPASSIDSD
jgi:hypothetical protein